MVNTFCEKVTTCIVPNFFQLLGKKWAFPICCAMKPEVNYSFEELIKITNRQVHRVSLSKILLEMKYYKVIEKKEMKYILTKKGEKIREKCLEISLIFNSDKFCKLQ